MVCFANIFGIISTGAFLLQGAEAAQPVKRALSETLGLSPNNLEKNGISMGFLPAWGERMSPNTATSLNALLPQPMAIVGAYAQILDTDRNFTQMEPYLADLLRQPGDRAVFSIALMPSQGLANITEEVAERIADKMADINARGVTVWLRYAHEMNGDWYAWGQQPAAFIASWNLVTAAVRAKAPDTYMLWAPNSMFAYDGSVDNPVGGYTPYWPGKDNVDIVGLSFYHYGGQARLNNYPTPNEAQRVMTIFDGLFASGEQKPMILAETGAAYTRDPDTGVPAVGNATESEIKWDWLWQITGPEIRQALPYYRALTWFEVLKDENAAGDTPIKEEDFRVITGNGTVAIGSRNYFAEQSTITNYVAPPVSLPGGDTNNSTNSSGIAAAGSEASSTAAPTGSGMLSIQSGLLGSLLTAALISWITTL